MKTLNIAVSDIEFNKFGLKEKISFSELLELVTVELSKKNLNDSVSFAEKYGLSSLSVEDINKEIKELRAHAKNNN